MTVNIPDNLLKFFFPPAIFILSLALGFPEKSFELIQNKDIVSISTSLIILLAIGFVISSAVYLPLNFIFRCLGILGEKELENLKKISCVKKDNEIGATRIIRRYDFAILNFNCVGAILTVILLVLCLSCHLGYKISCLWLILNILFLTLFFGMALFV